MNKKILPISFLTILFASYNCLSVETKYIPQNDPASPLTNKAIEERNLKMYEIASKVKLDERKVSERETIEKIEEWDAQQLLKTSKEFTLLKGGEIWEKDFGIVTIKLGIWGRAKDWVLLKFD